MSSGRANRSKIDYAEYDDSDFDDGSPAKKAVTKRVIDSEDEEVQEKPKKTGILAFAKEGVNNAREDLEKPATKKSKAPSK